LGLKVDGLKCLALVEWTLECDGSKAEQEDNNDDDDVRAGRCGK
jgi:hypothetical protein